MKKLDFWPPNSPDLSPIECVWAQVQKKLEDSIPSFSSPNFKLTEPRSISMVSYSKSIRDQIIPKKFIGIDPQLFLEPNKYIDLVNNHKKVSVPNFDIMSGRK